MKNIFTENIDKYGIINLIIWVSIPVILAIIICGKYDLGNTHTYQEESTTTTSTKRCQADPCPNNAVNGSIYCEIHKKGKTNKCAKCGKAIWDDETFCDTCLYGSIINSMSK